MTKTGVKYFEPKTKIAFYLRIILFELMFMLPVVPRIKLYLKKLTIIRVVYLSSTLSLHIILVINWFMTIKYVKNDVKIINTLIKIWQQVNPERTNIKVKYINRKIYLYEIYSFTLLIIILCHQDYVRGRFFDTLSYTFFELLLLKSIYQKVNVLFLLSSIFKDLNKKITTDMNTFEDFQFFINIYNQLIAIGKKLNQINGYYFLAVSLNSFIWLTYNLYKFVVINVLSFEKFPTLNVSMSIYLSCTWTGLQIFHFTFVVIGCCLVEATANEFTYVFGDMVQRLLHDRKNRYYNKKVLPTHIH